MNELSLSPSEKARKAYARVLSSVKEPGSQVAIAAALGTSEATISRIKNERLEECLAFIYAAGFKLVRSGTVNISSDALEFMRSVTAKVLADQQQARNLFEEGE